MDQVILSNQSSTVLNTLENADKNDILSNKLSFNAYPLSSTTTLKVYSSEASGANTSTRSMNFRIPANGFLTKACVQIDFTPFFKINLLIFVSSIDKLYSFSTKQDKYNFFMSVFFGKIKLTNPDVILLWWATE